MTKTKWLAECWVAVVAASWVLPTSALAAADEHGVDVAETYILAAVRSEMAYR